MKIQNTNNLAKIEKCVREGKGPLRPKWVHFEKNALQNYPLKKRSAKIHFGNQNLKMENM